MARSASAHELQSVSEDPRSHFVPGPREGLGWTTMMIKLPRRNQLKPDAHGRPKMLRNPVQRGPPCHATSELVDGLTDLGLRTPPHVGVVACTVPSGGRSGRECADGRWSNPWAILPISPNCGHTACAVSPALRGHSVDCGAQIATPVERAANTYMPCVANRDVSPSSGASRLDVRMAHRAHRRFAMSHHRPLQHQWP